MFLARRRFFLALGQLLGGLTLPFCAPAMADGDDLVAWTRRLYEREVARQNTLPPAPWTADDRRAFFDLFADDVRTWAQSPTAGNFRMPEGPILNAFFGWGVLPGHATELLDVRPARGSDRLKAADIDFRLRGERRRLTVFATRSADGWKIADLVYDRGESYASYQRRRSGH